MRRHAFMFPQVREITPRSITAHPHREPSGPPPTQRDLVMAALLRSPVSGATAPKVRY
jgi:hypothetical protein